MVYPEFDPYVFGLHWGAFGIRWYALAYVAGILLGWWYAVRLSRDDKAWGARAPAMTREQIDDLVLWVTLGVIVGGRLGSMIFYNTTDLWNRPLQVFKIWQGGMSFHGGLLGVALAMVLFGRAQKMSLFKISDLVAPVVPIGLFFGRIANFVNGELWGTPTRLPWGFYVDDGPLPLHPSQLYEAVLEGVVLFAIVWFVVHRVGQLKKPGFVTGVFLLGYGIFRTVVELFWRAPDENLANLPLGLHMGAILSLPMIIGGAWLMWRAKEGVDAAPAVAAPAPKTAPKAKTTAAPKAKSATKPKAKPTVK